MVRSAAGKLYLQKPGKFRWDYTEPSEQLILADGKQIWFYDKDLQQANVRNMDASLASTPAVLLSGGGSLSSQFDVTALPPSGGLEWYQLIPKHPDTDFQLVRIGFRNGRLGLHVPGRQAQSGHAADLHQPQAQRQTCAGFVYVRAAAGGRCDRARRQVTAGGTYRPLG